MMRLCDFVENFTGDPASAKREPWNKHDSVALAIIDDVIPLAVGEAVTVLDRYDGNDLSGPLNVFLVDV